MEDNPPVPSPKRRRLSVPTDNDDASPSNPTHNNIQGDFPPSHHRDVSARSTPPARSSTNTPHRPLSPTPSSSSSSTTHHQISSPPISSPPTLHYRQKLILRGHKKGVAAVRFSPDGKWIASCSADATVKIWSATTGKIYQTLEGHLAGISTIAWSPDSRTLASGSDDKSIRLWDVPTGKPYPVPLMGHQNYIYSIAISPKGNMLVSGSYDEAVFLWDVRSGRLMRSLPAHSDPVGGVDFVRDGTLVVSCAGDGLIRIWDTSTSQCLRTVVHEDNAPVSSVRFSPNGKFVLASTLDSCVRLWDYVDGRCVKTYQGHVNTKYSLGGAFGTYHHNKRVDAFVAAGSEDGRILLWDVKDKSVLQVLGGDNAHIGPVLGVDAREGILVSCGLDGTVRVWRAD
ncbi:MAG: WD domain protein [Caeruleum heppii]|nr:MAG: WD domain protein [Caeruleum heppii]